VTRREGVILRLVYLHIIVGDAVGRSDPTDELFDDYLSDQKVEYEGGGHYYADPAKTFSEKEGYNEP
jgi:hypothetical protein